jgi:hypothetical protein
MREFTPTELLKVQNLVGYIIDSPIPYYDQKSIFNEEGKCIWCEDWFHIEVLKYFINRDMYLRDRPPNRLKNTKFSREKMSIIVENKIAEIDAIDKTSNLLFIDKVGRGELLVYMNMFKKWDKIILEEDNIAFRKFLDFVCQVRWEVKIEFYNNQDLTNFVLIKGFESDICPLEN